MRRFTALLTILALAGGAVAAQELVYYEGDVRVYERVDGELFELQDSQDGMLDFGYRLDLNYVVKTFEGFAEVLLPNGHVLKLADSTEVQLESVLERGAGSGDDVVSVAAGRLRSVVSNLTGTGRGFQVRTPTAVGGVRGTDFVTQVAGDDEIIAVREGIVQFTNGAGSTISLQANQFANALAASFAATQANVAEQFYGSLDQLSEQTESARQQVLDELGLGEEEPVEDEEPAEEEQPADDEEPAEESGTDVDSGDAVVVEPQEPATPAEPDEGAAADTGEGPVDEFMANLTEALGLEIGSISLDGTTYSKLIAQPNFQIGKLRAGLYLPVIYSGNLFDRDDWYKPNGNDEWSFGTDQDWRNDTLGAIADLTGDIALKVKFIEWGDMRDPFFLKVGNLNTLTLGHGLLMRDYANDIEFPAIRRIGFNVGIDFGRVGFEVLTNDLAAPEIFGTRLYARPIGGFPLAVGVSGVADIAPASDLPETDSEGATVFTTEREADPIFVNLALDLDLPVVERDAFTLVLFGDVGGLLPYLRNSAGGLDAGFQTQALTHETASGTELRNYGIASGIFGNVSLLDFRLEFQNHHGIFEPAFYDANYDRSRGEKVAETIEYLQNPGAQEYENETLGIYGEAGFTIAELVRFDAGYLWPWTRNAQTNEVETGDDDYLLASLELQEGLLPLDISTSFAYERTQFVPTLINKTGFEGARLFDANTVLKGEVVYPVAPIMDIVATVTTTVLRDDAGNIIYEPSNGELYPKWGPVISIETRIGSGAGF
ncbi:MAG: FecR family protein [bacterium]